MVEQVETELEIQRLGARGDGVGAADGAPVHAPFTLPGERVRGAVEAGRMASPSILRQAAFRQTPPCRHFGTCGGCALQHGDDRFLAGWKRDLIGAALVEAGVACGELRETVVSPPRSRRRATFSARRTKKTVQVGFHARRSDAIVGVEDCPLIRPGLMAAIPAIADAARIGASRKGAIRGAATLSAAGVDLAIEDAKPLQGAMAAEAAALAEAHDIARLSWNGETVALARPPSQRFGPCAVTPPPGGFLQATEEGEAALVGAARQALAGARSVVDLFAGCGTFSLALIEMAEVHAVESDQAALTTMATGWRGAGGLKRLTTEARDLFRRPLLAQELARHDGAVIDPPRAGARAQSEQLASGGPPSIAAIACDPGNFARDARILTAGGYRLDWVLPVDQFRWSPHVELAARFSR